MRLSVIKALTFRNFRGTFTDKGRVWELVVFPLSFLLIWGLFFQSGIVEPKLAGQLLVINLIWSVSATFQAQANLTLMFDLWSREFANIMRQGVRIGEMLLAHLVFSTILGLINLFLFLFFIVYSFGGTHEQTRLFYVLFPLYYLSAMGLAAIFGGLVIMLGRSYGFIAWTGLQLLIMVSSPFSPLATLPPWLAFIAELSPFTAIFEYVRFERTADYQKGLVLGVIYLIGGIASAVVSFRVRRARQGLMDI